MSEAVSYFPPYPDLVAGAMRAALAQARGWDPAKHEDWSKAGLGIETTLGASRTDSGTLSFSEPMLIELAANKIRYYPAPLHLARRSEDNKDLVLLAPPPKSGSKSDLGPVRHIRWRGGEKPVEAPEEDGAWINADHFALVLRGEDPADGVRVTKSERLWTGTKALVQSGHSMVGVPDAGTDVCG